MNGPARAAEPSPAPRPGGALARFWDARGYRVFEAVGVLWAVYRPPIGIALPYEQRMDLDPRALQAALRRARVAAVRYPTVTQRGWPSGMFMCVTGGGAYSLETVEHRHRKQVQKGLSRCEVRVVGPDELLEHGLEVNLETMQRQGRFDAEFGDPARWRRVVDAVRACPEVVVKGAFIDGRLSAYAILCRDGAWLHLLYKNTRSADMIHRTNPALDYRILVEASQDPGLEGVTNGWLSVIDGADGLHQYKQLMGYRIVETPLAIRFHPALAPVVTSRWAAAATGALERLRPQDTRVQLVARVVKGARLSR